MNWRLRDKIIEAMFHNKDLYIKNTGVKVSVDYFGSDLNDDNWGRGRSKKSPFTHVKIEFMSPPTIKALKLCRKYHIKKNSHSKTMELDAEIEIDQLSLVPYEGKAANLVYEVKK